MSYWTGVGSERLRCFQTSHRKFLKISSGSDDWSVVELRRAFLEIGSS